VCSNVMHLRSKFYSCCTYHIKNSRISGKKAHSSQFSCNLGYYQPVLGNCTTSLLKLLLVVGIPKLNLAYNNENNKVTSAEAGGISTILSAMKTHSSNATVQDKGCGALVNLANNDKNKVTIADAGGITTILSAMKTHSSNATVQ